MQVADEALGIEEYHRGLNPSVASSDKADLWKAK